MEYQTDNNTADQVVLDVVRLANALVDVIDAVEAIAPAVEDAATLAAIVTAKTVLTNTTSYEAV